MSLGCGGWLVSREAYLVDGGGGLKTDDGRPKKREVSPDCTAVATISADSRGPLFLALRTFAH